MIEPRYFTASEEAILRAMWLTGCSGGQIAKKLGRTRSGILGKVFRLGLQRTWQNHKIRKRRKGKYA